MVEWSLFVVCWKKRKKKFLLFALGTLSLGGPAWCVAVSFSSKRVRSYNTFSLDSCQVHRCQDINGYKLESSVVTQLRRMSFGSARHKKGELVRSSTIKSTIEEEVESVQWRVMLPCCPISYKKRSIYSRLQAALLYSCWIVM